MSEYTADLTEMLLTAAEPEPHIVVAADRSVLVPDDLKEIATQFDHNIETVTFDCPRYWDGHDFSKMHVFVNYRCADGKIDSYPCDPPTVDAEDETIIHFDWTLSRNVTCAKGVISFLVCVKSSDKNGVLQQQWSSRLNQEMEVLEGIECNTEEIIPDDPDVIERILNRLDELERNGGGGSGGGGSGGVYFTTDNTLSLKDGILSVNTADAVEEDNTLPITSSAVYQTVGNIEILLKTI